MLQLELAFTFIYIYIHYLQKLTLIYENMFFISTH